MNKAIISEITVRNFRSLRNIGPISFSTSNAIIGVNSSGKSNLLRALNWFFNNRVDNDHDISLSADISHSKKAGKKQKISVTVTFNYEAIGNLPQTLRRKWTPNKNFSITKTIRYEDKILVPSFVLDRGLPADENEDFSTWIEGFLSLYKYRYIPSYRNPSCLIREIISEAQRIIEPKVKRKLTIAKKDREKSIPSDPDGTDVFRNLQTSIQSASAKIFDELEKKTVFNLSNIESLKAGLPDNWLSFLSQLGFKFTTKSGGVVNEEAQGSGAQSYVFFLLLSFVAKQTRAYGFGWRQGEIWGIEEPEIFLHHSLCSECASIFNEIANPKTGEQAPVQVIITTHSSPFVEAMHHRVVIDIGSDGYTRVGMGRKDSWPIVEGVIPYTHPIFEELSKKLIIVEGTNDKLIIDKFLELNNKIEDFRVVRVSDLLNISSSDNSKKQMVDFLKKNAAAIVIRGARQKVFFLFDADVAKDQSDSVMRRMSEEIESLQIQKKANEICDAICLKFCDYNPTLDESFHGIERFLPTRVILSACKNNNIKLSYRMANRTRIYSIPEGEIGNFNTNKSKIVREFVNKSKKNEDWKFVSLFMLKCD
jgi:hypothetical protein